MAGQFRDVAGTVGDGDQGPLSQAVVEPGRGGLAGVSHARQAGASGDDVLGDALDSGDLWQSADRVVYRVHQAQEDEVGAAGAPSSGSSRS